MSNYTDVLDNIKPVSGDVEFINSVLGRNKKKTAAKIRNLCVTMIVMVGLTAATITAGAVNDWDYAAIFQRIFGGNQAVVDNMHREINYEVVSNTFDGLTFEVSALYADSESMLVIVNISADEPTFMGRKGTSMGGAGRLSVGYGIEGWPDTFSYQVDSYVIDELLLIAVFHFAIPETPITVGSEYSIHFGEYSIHFGDHDQSPITLRDGSAEIRFTVDSLDTQNLIIVNPDITLESGTIFGDVTIYEIRLNPFGLTIRYDYETDYATLEAVFIELYEISMNNPNDFYSAENHSRSLEIGALPVELEYIEMADGEKKYFDDSSGWVSGESGYMWIPENDDEFFGYSPETPFRVLSFRYDMLLDTDDVAAIVIQGVRIPVQ